MFFAHLALCILFATAVALVLSEVVFPPPSPLSVPRCTPGSAAPRLSDAALRGVSFQCAQAALAYCGHLKPTCRVLLELKCAPPSPGRNKSMLAVAGRLDRECRAASAPVQVAGGWVDVRAILAARVILAAVGGGGSARVDAQITADRLADLAGRVANRRLTHLQRDLALMVV